MPAIELGARVTLIIEVSSWLIGISLFAGMAPADTPTVQRPAVQRPGQASPPAETPAPVPVPEPTPPGTPPPVEGAQPEAEAPAEAPTPSVPSEGPPAAAPPSLPPPSDGVAPSVTEWESGEAVEDGTATPSDSPLDDEDGAAVAPPGMYDDGTPTPTPTPTPIRRSMEANEELRAEIEDAQAAGRSKSSSPALVGGFRRSGLIVGAAAGFMNCPQASCDPMKVGGNGQFELGYRRRWFAVELFLDGGGGKYADDFFEDRWGGSDSVGKGKMTFFGVGAQVLFFPVQSGRVDPYFGGGLAYQRVKTLIESEEDIWYGGDGGFNGDINDESGGILRRPAGRASVGLDVFVSQRVALGPRADFWWPFRGKACPNEEAEHADPCAEIGPSAENLEQDFEERSTRNQLPKARSLSLHLSATF